MLPSERARSDDEELDRLGLVIRGELGEGSYAKVKWATSESLGGRKVALKIISKKKAPSEFQRKFMPRELEVMKTVNHPNIIRLHDIHIFNNKVVLVMELAGHGDLLAYVKLRGALPEHVARRLFRQLLSAVAYLHSINIVHRDLKCENILLDVDNNIKLSDFGFSRIIQPDQLSQTYCGSAAYAAPEVLQGIPYRATAYDIWSIGVILYILVCGSMPFDDSDVKKMIKVQTERKVNFSRRVRLTDDVMHLIHAILEARVERRVTTASIAAHPWMTSPSPPVTAAPSVMVAKPLATNTSTNNKKKSVKSDAPAPSRFWRRGGNASIAVGAVEEQRPTVAGLLGAGAETGNQSPNAVDTLSHNNNSFVHERPRPIDKAMKSTQLNVVPSPNLAFDTSLLMMIRESWLTEDTCGETGGFNVTEVNVYVSGHTAFTNCKLCKHILSQLQRFYQVPAVGRRTTPLGQSHLLTTSTTDRKLGFPVAYSSYVLLDSGTSTMLNPRRMRR